MRSLLLCGLIALFSQSISADDTKKTLTPDEKLKAAKARLAAAQVRLEAAKAELKKAEEAAKKRLSATASSFGSARFSFQKWRQEMEFVKGFAKAVDKYSDLRPMQKFRFKLKLQSDQEFRQRVIEEFGLAVKLAGPTLLGSSAKVAKVMASLENRDWAQFWKDFPWEEWTAAMKEIIPMVMEIIKIFVFVPNSHSFRLVIKAHRERGRARHQSPSARCLVVVA